MTKKILIMILLTVGIGNTFAQSFDLLEVDNELCKIGNEDQQIRKKLIEAAQKQSSDLASIIPEMNLIDTKNQAYVSNLLDNHGWPENLSVDANRAIFLVIDHAKNPFSEKYFPLVKEMADKGVLQKSDVATLEDRILMRSQKSQKYGTQTISKKTQGGNNAIYVWPVENDANLDELRASVGLPPINQYLKILESQHNQKVIWDKDLTVTDFNIISFN